MKLIDKLVERFIKSNKRMKRWKRCLSVLAALVVFVTTYALVLPGITLDSDTASTKPGIEVAASENEADDAGTVYESVPEEEPDEETKDEAVEEPAPVEDPVKEESGSESGSQSAEADSEQKETASTEAVNDKEEPESGNTDMMTDDQGDASEETAAAEQTSEKAAEVDENADAASTEKAAASLTNEVAPQVELITEQTQLIYEAEDYKVFADFGEEAKLPVGVQLKVKEITKESDPEAYEAYYEKALAQMQDKYDENVALSFAKFYDIAFVYDGVEIEPAGNVNVRIEYEKAVEIEETTAVDTIHFDKDDEEKVEVIDSEAKGTEDKVETVEFESDKFSVYGIVCTETITTKVMTASGETYEISVTYGPEAEIPNGATLKADEILEGSDKYETYFDKTLEALQEQAADENYLAGLDFARFFDVTIYDSEGVKIEPKAPVEVKITYVDPLEVADSAELKVVHFADQGTEIIDIDNGDKTVSEIVYEQNGFSVIGTVGATDAYGWPQGGDNPYVIVLQSGDKYYAVAHNGTLKEVHYLNGTVSFMGQGTTTLDYLNDYLWDYTVRSSTRHTGLLSTYGEETPLYMTLLTELFPAIRIHL